MKKILLVAVLLLMATSAYATPYLMCDPQAGITSYKVTGLPFVTADVPAQADGSLKVDVAPSSVGVNAITISACKEDALWGKSCSASSPFSYTRPSLPVGLKNLRIGQ
jgi:hypothetical protein